MAAQMEVNQASDNTVLGQTAGDLPNDGTGKLFGITAAVRRTKMNPDRRAEARSILGTIQRRPQDKILESARVDKEDQ